MFFHNTPVPNDFNSLFNRGPFTLQIVNPLLQPDHFRVLFYRLVHYVRDVFRRSEHINNFEGFVDLHKALVALKPEHFFSERIDRYHMILVFDQVFGDVVGWFRWVSRYSHNSHVPTRLQNIHNFTVCVIIFPENVNAIFPTQISVPLLVSFSHQK